MVNVYPSILVNSQEEFLKQISEASVFVDFVQIDIADGAFVPQKNWYDAEVTCNNIKINFELHMMVAEPLLELEKWLHIPELKRVIVHYESLRHPLEELETLQETGKEVCLCLNPDTKVDVVDELIDAIDCVQLMSVYPGKQGQPFLEETYEKVRTLRHAYPDLPIGVDGGVTQENLPVLVESGANNFAPGSAIWKGNPKENFRNFEEIVNSLTD